MKNIFYTGLGNYYGSLKGCVSGDKFYLGLEDYSSEDYIEISEELFKMIKKECSEKEEI